MKSLFLVTLLFLSINVNSQTVVDGVAELKKNRRVLQCYFGGKIYEYRGVWDIESDDDTFYVCLDKHCKAKVHYSKSTNCRYLRNKYLDPKRYRRKK